MIEFTQNNTLDDDGGNGFRFCDSDTKAALYGMTYDPVTTPDGIAVPARIHIDTWQEGDSGTRDVYPRLVGACGALAARDGYQTVSGRYNNPEEVVAALIGFPAADWQLVSYNGDPRTPDRQQMPHDYCGIVAPAMNRFGGYQDPNKTSKGIDSSAAIPEAVYLEAVRRREPVQAVTTRDYRSPDPNPTYQRTFD